MLNTRHKLAPRARAGRHGDEEEIITNEQLSPQSVFLRRGGSSPGDWSWRDVSQCRGTGMAIFQPRELISVPISRPTSRAPVTRALKRRSTPPFLSRRFICGVRRREYIARGACFERSPAPHARIFGRFHPVTPNVLKIPTEYDGKIPFIALIHFVGRREFRSYSENSGRS